MGWHRLFEITDVEDIVATVPFPDAVAIGKDVVHAHELSGIALSRSVRLTFFVPHLLMGRSDRPISGTHANAPFVTNGEWADFIADGR